MVEYDNVSVKSIRGCISKAIIRRTKLAYEWYFSWFVFTLTNYLCGITILNEVSLTRRKGMPSTQQAWKVRIFTDAWPFLKFCWKNCCCSCSRLHLVEFHTTLVSRGDRKQKRGEAEKEGEKEVSGQEYLPRVEQFPAVVLAVGSLLEFILENGVSCYLRNTFAHRFTN